jgi:uncharacterized membrane protein
MNETATPDQLLGAGVLGFCCCLIGAAGFIGVVVWMLRNRNQPAQPPVNVAPPVAPPSEAAFHLSVIALAFDGYFRPQVEAMLSAAGNSLDPVGARVELVQRAARALLGVEPQWRHFGYGEKDLVDLTGAQQSYGSAIADFRARSARSEDGGTLVVLTIVLCTRGRRLGVDRLDTRAQVHELLTDRLRVEASTLLGADVLWAPPAGGLTEFAIKERFPEMHALST